MSHDVKNVLNAILEAQEAYNRQPELERRIRELEAEQARINNQFNDALVHSSELESKLGDTQAKLQEKESELEAATFRELLAEEKLNKVSTLLRGIGDLTASGLDEASPEPNLAPMAEPADVPVDTPALGIGSDVGSDQDVAKDVVSQPQPKIEAYYQNYSGPSPTPTPEAPNQVPADGYAPGAMDHRAWWTRPHDLSEDRFVELGGEATLDWKVNKRKSEDAAKQAADHKLDWSF